MRCHNIVDKGLYPFFCGHCGHPCLCSVKKNSIDISIENPDLGFSVKERGNSKYVIQRHIRHSLSDDMAKAGGSSLVQSRLDYANSILCGVAPTHLNKLQHGQNSLAQAALPNHHQLSYHQLLRELHWLPIDSISDLHLLLITLLPLASQPTTAHLFIPMLQLALCSLQSSEQQLLQVPRCFTDVDKRAFSHCGPRLWSNIRLHLHLSPSVDSFERCLKSFYFTYAP